MIKTFRCEETKAIFNREGSRKFRAIEKQAQRRLAILDSAPSLLDLAALRSNHLEALGADRKGQHSIRVNKQWRVCFVWNEKGRRKRGNRRLPLRRENYGQQETRAGLIPAKSCSKR